MSFRRRQLGPCRACPISVLTGPLFIDISFGDRPWRSESPRESALDQRDRRPAEEGVVCGGDSRCGHAADRMSGRWIGVAIAFEASLVLLLVLVAVDADASVRTRTIEAVVFVGVPALVSSRRLRHFGASPTVGCSS